MTTIRQQPQLPVIPRFPTPATTIVPGNLGGIGRALKDVFADTHSSYKSQLRGMDDKSLASEAKRLQGVIADASSGGDKNSSVVTRAKAQLAEVKEEQTARAGFAQTSDPAWAKKAHGMNDAQLGTERARQLERYQEATTGLDRDPKKAADAKSKLEFLNKESFGRVLDRFQGAMPKATPTKPTGLAEHLGDFVKYRSMSPEQLSAEKTKLRHTLRDATTGPHQDVQLAANTRQKLELIQHCEAPGSKPISEGDMKKYQKQLEHCSTPELQHHHRECKKQEHDCVAKGDLIGAGNARRKGELCEGAMVRHRGELAECKRNVGAMTDRQLSDFASKLDQQLHDPSKASRRGELCEQQQICRHEQHRRLCEQHFPGTQPTPGDVRPGDERRSVVDLLKDLLRGAERYQEATTGVDQSPKGARDALKDIERDLKQLLSMLTSAMQA